MNDARRKALAVIRNRLEVMLDDLETIRDDEQEAAEAIPESMEQRKLASEDAADLIEEACGDMKSVIDSLSQIE